MDITDTTVGAPIDIVVASVIAVAFGVIFWAWGLLWNGRRRAFAAARPRP